MTTHDPCAYCANFTIAGHAELAATGHGQCTAWGEPKPWNGQIGVLFKEAKDRAPRARYVAMQQAKTETEQRASA